MLCFFIDIGNWIVFNDCELFCFIGGFEGYFILSDIDFDYDVYYICGEVLNVCCMLNDLIFINFLVVFDLVIDFEIG